MLLALLNVHHLPVAGRQLVLCLRNDPTQRKGPLVGKSATQVHKHRLAAAQHVYVYGELPRPFWLPCYPPLHTAHGAMPAAQHYVADLQAVANSSKTCLHQLPSSSESPGAHKQCFTKWPCSIACWSSSCSKVARLSAARAFAADSATCYLPYTGGHPHLNTSAPPATPVCRLPRVSESKHENASWQSKSSRKHIGTPLSAIALWNARTTADCLHL